jgi:hypothetical protein
MRKKVVLILSLFIFASGVLMFKEELLSIVRAAASISASPTSVVRGGTTTVSFTLPTLTDNDKDGYYTVAVSGKAADCDDNDARAFPGQSAYFRTPRNSGGGPTSAFDFNCDGTNSAERIGDPSDSPNDPAGAYTFGYGPLQTGGNRVWVQTPQGPSCGVTLNTFVNPRTPIAGNAMPNEECAGKRIIIIYHEQTYASANCSGSPQGHAAEYFTDQNNDTSACH